MLFWYVSESTDDELHVKKEFLTGSGLDRLSVESGFLCDDFNSSPGDGDYKTNSIEKKFLNGYLRQAFLQIYHMGRQMKKNSVWC